MNYYLGYNALQYSYISEIIICSRYLLWFGEVRNYLGYNALQYSYISEIIICSRYLLRFGSVNYYLGYNALQYSYISGYNLFLVFTRVWRSEKLSRLQCSTIFIYLTDYNLF